MDEIRAEQTHINTNPQRHTHAHAHAQMKERGRFPENKKRKEQSDREVGAKDSS